MVCSSQNSLPHFLQLTLPFAPPNLLPHVGSKHASLYEGFCQCFRVTYSSGSTARAGSGMGVEWPLKGFVTGGGGSFDSKTSRPLNFWFNTARGWNFFALSICTLNQSLTSSCCTSSRLAWVSSRCLWSAVRIGSTCKTRDFIPIQLQKGHLSQS